MVGLCRLKEIYFHSGNEFVSYLGFASEKKGRFGEFSCFALSRYASNEVNVDFSLTCLTYAGS